MPKKPTGNPSGRPKFQPTPNQQTTVQFLVSLGVPQAEICNLVWHNEKPITEKTLRKHFRREIAQGDVALKARMGNFLIATIEGRQVDGFVEIKDERTRGQLLQLYAHSRLGWNTRVSAEVGNAKDPAGNVVPFVYQASKTDSML
jgi:hypothetical protein